jgi:two-component system chemotaxis response regulator CheY
MRVLVVDDSTTMRRIIINTLNRLGHEDIVEAANGREGLERLTELAGAVDLIITDSNMPEMSGLDFVRAVRGVESMRALPVLMITTNASREDIVQARQAGVNDYIVKPFTPEVFRDKILAASAAGAK